MGFRQGVKVSAPACRGGQSLGYRAVQNLRERDPVPTYASRVCGHPSLPPRPTAKYFLALASSLARIFHGAVPRGKGECGLAGACVVEWPSGGCVFGYARCAERDEQQQRL